MISTHALEARRPVQAGFAATGTRFLQRKCACGGSPGAGGECEECRKKRLTGSNGTQPISRPAPLANKEVREIEVGHTDCDWDRAVKPDEPFKPRSGDAKVKLSGEKCTLPCTAEHEAVHIAQVEPICKSYFTCYTGAPAKAKEEKDCKDMPKPDERKKCEDLYTEFFRLECFVAVANAWDAETWECAAYKKSLACVEKELARGDKDCQGKLKEYKESAQKQIAKYCKPEKEKKKEEGKKPEGSKEPEEPKKPAEPKKGPTEPKEVLYRAGTLQRESDARAGDEPDEAPAIVHEVLRSSGQPLDPAARSFMEPRFGHDFSQVRIHTDLRAAESARAVNALAYTMGQNIVFGADQYSPARSSGRRLLAHELAHVVQQGDAAEPGLQRTNSSLELGEANDPLEHEADSLAASVANGRQVDATRRTTPAALRRQGAAAANSAAAAQPPAPTATDATSREPERFVPEVDLGRMSRFFNGRADARLNRGPALAHARRGGARDDTPPCQLDLFLKLQFEFHLGPAPFREGGPSGTMTEPGPPWPAGRAARWKRDYMRVAQETWRTRHALELSGTCANEPCTRAVGQLRVVDAESMTDSTGQPVQVSGMSSTPHFNVTVFEFRPQTGRDESRVMGSSSTMFEEDVLPPNAPAPPGFDRERFTWRPGAAAHETGHMLGRPHSNCAPDADNPNNERCYGELGSPERANVMGRGSEFSREDHAPFLAAMHATTGCNWRVPSEGLPWWAIALLAVTGVGLIVIGILALAGKL